MKEIVGFLAAMVVVEIMLDPVSVARVFGECAKAFLAAMNAT